MEEYKRRILSQPGARRHTEGTTQARPVSHPQVAGGLVEEEGLAIISFFVI